MIVRVTTFCLVAILPYIYCEGLLYTKLVRYKNDTCGVYVTQSNVCCYKVSLSIESYILRGRQLTKKIKHYNITNDDTPFSSTQFEIVFPINLGGSLLNPIPIKIIEGSVNVTLSVDNKIDRLFHRTYTFNTDVMEADSVIPYNDVMGTGFVILTTELRCNPRFNGTGCLECETGWFGYRCSVQCTSGSRYTCHPLTGERVCEDHYYGKTCEKYCKATLNYICTQSGDRLCLYPAIGVYCDKTTTCPENQHGANCQVTCRPVPGQFTCDEEGGRVCGGPFTGPNCTSCQPHHYGPYCNTTCTPRTAPRAAPRAAPRYTCDIAGARVCGVGWSGMLCEECAEMWLGEECEVFCNTTSPRYTCTAEGYRTCRGNWDGSGCQECKKHYYGRNCQVYCPASDDGWWNCNTTTGERVCVSPRTGENCSQCRNGYYLVPNTTECGKCEITEQSACTQQGAESCKPTWYGRDCAVNCESTEKYDCFSNGSRNCYGNFSGETCETCKANYFGLNCSVYCHETIWSICDSNGVKHCRKDRYNPPSCRRYCDSSATTYTCSPTGDRVCVGERDLDTECEKCNANLYGVHCNVSCVKEGNFTCNEEGERVCLEGWTGINCDECASNWYSHTCGDGGGNWWGGDGGACVKTCSTFCEDLVNYKCNSEGVLELVAAERYEDNYYELKVFLIVFSWAVFYLLGVCVMVKTSPRWCKVPEKGK